MWNLWRTGVQIGACALTLLLISCGSSDPGNAEGDCKGTEECEDGFVCNDGVCEEDELDSVIPIDNGPPPATSDLPDFGDACADGAEPRCKTGLQCVSTTEGPRCTRRCDLADFSSCDPLSDWQCLTLGSGGTDAASICLPPAPFLCKTCEADGDCGIGGGLCLAQNDGRFCATPCGALGCIDGYDCVEHDVEGTSHSVCVPNSGFCLDCVDEDNDGYGRPGMNAGCPYPNEPDCDDNDNSVYPGAPQKCDLKTSDCAEGAQPDEPYRDPVSGDYTHDSHCGMCGNDCVGKFPNAIGTCGEDLQCALLECKPDFGDADGDHANGCECTVLGEESTPALTAPFGADRNCDGVNGDRDNSVFVSAAFGIDDSTCGTMFAPCASVQAGILRADGLGRNAVLIAGGNYYESETVTLKSGIGLYGGYQPQAGLTTWNRASDVATRLVFTPDLTVNGNLVGLRGENLTDETHISLITIETMTPMTPSASVYGVHCVGCDGLRVQHVTIINGDAMAGPAGQNLGENALVAGGRGTDGTDGTHSDSGLNAPGGTSACSSGGGKGGRAGYGSGGGGNGSAGAGPSPGDGGGGGGRKGTGAAGKAGSSGPAGGHGSPGGSPGGILPAGFWAGNNGGNGSTGVHGSGGGGGGGGGGHDPFAATKRRGGDGGGGGGGGCAGGGADGGQAGGSSFGIFLAGSAAAKIQDTNITVGNGGSGGAGQAGGVGSSGGAAGGGGNGHKKAGNGGDGGPGGKGGDGGAGGGGAGGHSIGIVGEFDALLLGLPNGNLGNTFVLGNAGSGGNSPHAPASGAAGQALEQLVF